MGPTSRIVLICLAENFFIFDPGDLAPQELYFLAALLVHCRRLPCFLFTAVAGRLWCGLLVSSNGLDRSISVDRTTSGRAIGLGQMKLDRSALSFNKVLEKKRSSTLPGLAVSIITAITFVGYFKTDRRALPGS